MQKILITGVAGFVGFHLADKLLSENISVIGIDNINSYYDVDLKIKRLDILKKNNLIFQKIDLNDKHKLTKCFEKYNPDIVVNLAAQAGVRFSLKKPDEYMLSNITGFYNILEASKNINCKRLIYASSSSVYGQNSSQSFKESHSTDYPLNLYAASKKTNELLAYSYSNMFDLKSIGLRLFTVYGPWGRPDMAYFKFTKKIFTGEEINVFNYGNMIRDFTYIDDVISCIYKLIFIKNLKIFNKKVPHKIYNIGNNKPESLKRFISILEKEIGKQAKIKFVKFQVGDVKKTSANISLINEIIKFQPKTTIDEGLPRFVKWFKKFYN